jgi:hypothetical protein
MTTYVDYSQIRIVPTAVFRQIGYPPGAKVSEKVQGRVSNRLKQVEAIARPAYSMVMRKVESVRPGSVTIEGITFESEVLGHLLTNSPEVGVFALTVGPEIEEIARDLTNTGASFDAAIVDAIGSALVQKLVKFVQTRSAAAAAERGMAVSKRFCPGYCDWNVSQQKGLFALLHDDTPGITLTEDCLMLPHKSMSGMIGFGAKGEQVRNYVPCRNCQMRDCIGRS